MTLLVHVIVVAIFVVWLVATTIQQFPTRWGRAMRRRNVLSLVPQWTFFAPNPGRADMHVLFRDRLADGSFTGWIELHTSENRRLRSALWNPEKRAKKAVHDAIQSLGSSVSRDQPTAPELMLTRPYLMLLTLVCSMNAAADATHRQFVVVATADTDPDATPQLQLRSAVHPL
jgi:hypothetical protein